eukprot:COSAG01_NODE_6088_length_3860_cov_7.538421_2_plen_68_part_00
MFRRWYGWGRIPCARSLQVSSAQASRCCHFSGMHVPGRPVRKEAQAPPAHACVAVPPSDVGQEAGMA